MENEVLNNQGKIEKILEKIKEKQKVLISISVLLVVIIILFAGYTYNLGKKSEKVAEKYIQAGIYLSNNDLKISENIFQEIIFSKNKIYSPLALYAVVDNNLENDKEKILDYFEIVEKLKVEKNQLDLIKFKKALYLLKISEQEKGKKILEELVNSNSAWKETALEILN